MPSGGRKPSTVDKTVPLMLLSWDRASKKRVWWLDLASVLGHSGGNYGRAQQHGLPFTEVNLVNCCLLNDLLAIETKAEFLTWHHPSKRPTSLLVAICIHQVSSITDLGTLERAMFHPYQQHWHILYGFAFPAWRALALTTTWKLTERLIYWRGILISSKGTYLTAEEYGSGGMTMVFIGLTTYSTI